MSNLEEGKRYNLSAKRENGKWWSYGRLEINKYGNWSIGMKVTDELIDMLNSKRGGYFNLSVFEDKPRTHHDVAKQDGYQPDQGIPF